MFPGLYFAKENYILVYQDIRGMFRSEGRFEFFSPYKKDKITAADVDESCDAYDTVEWILENVPNHNGKVGVWGISYTGFTAAMAAISAHPAVLAVSPQAPMGDLFLGDDGHHYGALYLAHYANYLCSMGQACKGPTKDPLPRLRYPTPDGYSFFLQLDPLKNITAKILGSANEPWIEAMAHETYDAYWKELSIYPHLRDIKPAILRVGGWYDAEDLLGTLQRYETIEKQNPGRVTKVELELPDIQHAFLKGHRIMIQVQSSWFPLFDRNPQTFCDIRTARETDFRKATHRLYHARQYPSRITFKVLTK